MAMAKVIPRTRCTNGLEVLIDLTPWYQIRGNKETIPKKTEKMRWLKRIAHHLSIF